MLTDFENSHAHMLLYASGVNYNVNSNYTKYLTIRRIIVSSDI